MRRAITGLLFSVAWWPIAVAAVVYGYIDAARVARREKKFYRE